LSTFRGLLEQTKLFADVPPSALDQLTDLAHRRTVASGEILFHQDDPAQVFCLVLSGRFRLIQHSVEGKDVTMAVFVPGEVIGLVVALTNDPYPGSVEALENGEVLLLPGAPLWSMMNEHGGLAVRVLRLVAGRLQEAQNRIRELSVERVQQRIARCLLRLTQKVGVKEDDGAIRLDLPLSRQDIAQMTGTTLETVSRTIAAWERDGILDAGREQITLRKPHQLVEIAEDLPV
jgi:CRP-like cAMP-binding protein